MTSTRPRLPVSRPLRTLIDDLAAAGYRIEHHDQSFNAAHPDTPRRSYTLWLNAGRGFLHASRYQGDACTGEYSTLRAFRTELGLR